MTPSDLTKAQWDQIVAILKSEMSTGRLKNVQWTNVAGVAQTSTIAVVNRSLHLYTGLLPAIGVQLQKGQVSKYSTAERWLANEFTLQIAVQADAYSATVSVPANGDDALTQAWAFISDGTGNGISEIFRDPLNRTLNNTCTQVFVTSVVPVLSVGEGNTPQVWADIYVTLRVDSQLSIHN